MPKLVDRNPASAPGDWYIDHHCIDCTASREVAPGLIIHHQGKSVFARQPANEEEELAAWRALLVCPTASVGTESHRSPPPDLFPQELAPGAALPLIRLLSMRRPGGTTPMAEAVIGTLTNLRDRVAAMPGRHAAMIVATDGLPGGCRGPRVDYRCRSQDRYVVSCLPFWQRWLCFVESRLRLLVVRLINPGNDGVTHYPNRFGLVCQGKYHLISSPG